MDVSLSRFGPSGILIRFAERADETSLARCRGLMRWLEENPLEGVLDMVPAYDSLLLEFSAIEGPCRLMARLKEQLKNVRPLAAGEVPLRRIPVVYDGPDLEELAGRLGLSAGAVVEIHSASIYDVQVIGFSPGFPYLGPLDERLHMPRRAVPRVRVPAGSVAIGGSHTGVYSIASPGGWWLIGRTGVEMFSLRRSGGQGGEEAFLLRPGDRICFEPVTP